MWLGAVWLFSDEPRLSSLWQTVRTVDANVNTQPVGKQMLPALSILLSPEEAWKARFLQDKEQGRIVVTRALATLARSVRGDS